MQSLRNILKPWGFSLGLEGAEKSVKHKSRTLLQYPPSRIRSKSRYEALTTVDTHNRGLHGKTLLAAHSGYCKMKLWVLVVDDSLLRVTEGPICWPDREWQEVGCFLGAKIQDVAERVPKLVKLIIIHCYSFIWAQMAPQAGIWAESRKTTKPWGCKQKVFVPKLSFLPFYQLEECVQPETDV